MMTDTMDLCYLYYYLYYCIIRIITNIKTINTTYNKPLQWICFQKLKMRYENYKLIILGISIITKKTELSKNRERLQIQ